MTRKKVKLAFIVNDAARKATYKKRKKSLLKKVDELSTLCGIEACAIVYGPYEPQPEIWPSPWGVQKVLSKFRAKPEFEQTKKMANQETFMKQRVSKAKDKLTKLRKDNREKETSMLIDQCINEGKIVRNDMSLVDLNYLGWLINHNLKNIGRKLDAWDDNNNVQIQSHNMTTESQVQLHLAPPPLPLISKNEEMAMMSHGHVGMPINNVDIMERQFFMDMTMNGNGDETTPFDEINSAFLPNLLP